MHWLWENKKKIPKTGSHLGNKLMSGKYTQELKNKHCNLFIHHWCLQQFIFSTHFLYLNTQCHNSKKTVL